MARIKEFRGLRPKDAQKTAELPYDVLREDEIRKITGKNKLSFYHVTRSEADLPEGTDQYSDAVYEKSRENLNNFIKDKFFIQDQEDSFYLYTQVMNGRSQTGLVACTHIDDYENNIIKKHELVLDSKAEDRRKHIDILNANTGLVFLFFKQEENKKSLFIEAIQTEPVYDFTSDDGIRHIFRIIKNKKLKNYYKDYFKNKNLYIADGHHRAHSAYKVGLERKKNNVNHTGNEEYNWFMSVLFPHNELMILSYNRMVTDLNNFTEELFLKEIEKNFTVKADDKKTNEKFTLRMYLKKWYKLIPKFPKPDDPVESLDVQLLQKLILDPVLGIKNPKNDKRIDFFPGIRDEKEIEQLIDSGKFKVAFVLHPVIIDELIRVSDADLLMPPKSTWFEPKLRSGLVVHLI
jgi:uncharacterized protein (DUF1015 family)